MKTSLLTIVAFLALQITNAQHTERCANSYKHAEYLEKNPDEVVNFKNIENQLQKIIQKGYTTRSTSEVYQIPVVIHVMHNGEAEGVGNNISDTQVISGITQLNNAFRNTGGQGIDSKIEFVLAKQDPDCNVSTGIVRYDASGITGYATDGIAISSVGADELTLKAASKWSNTDYYNIWVVSEIEGNDGGFGTQGFAYFPGTSSARDGTIILNTAWGNTGTANSWNNQGKTGIHELGHGLDLHHTFKVQSSADTTANGCPSNTNCATEGDLCCDTDPHKVSASFTCTDAQTNECTGNLFGDVVHNYMDYSDQDCQYMFTQDQIDRMRATLESTRSSLLVSKGLSTSLTAFASPIAPSCIPETDTAGLNNGYAGIMNVSFHNLNASSSYTLDDGGYIDYATECLKVAYVHPDSIYDFSVTSWENVSKTKAWIDYNNDGSFTSNELVYDQTLASKTKVSQSVTISNTATEGQFLRMRVLLDLNTVTDACMNPTYGQTEDYSVYIYKIYTVSGTIYEATTTSSVCGTTGSDLLNVSLFKGGQTHYTTTTDALGKYSFTGVAAGTYDLHIDSSGYDNVTAPEITVAGDVINEEYIEESTSINVCNNTTGVNYIQGISNLRISPNPATSSFVLNFNSTTSESITYQLTDIQGKVIERGSIAGAILITKGFNIESLNSGVYVLSLGNKNGTTAVQVIKR